MADASAVLLVLFQVLCLVLVLVLVLVLLICLFFLLQRVSLYPGAVLAWLDLGYVLADTVG